MRDLEILQAVVDTVPQWYQSNVGRNVYSYNLNGNQLTFCSHRALTPDLSELNTFIRLNLNNWEASLPDIITPTTIGKIREDIALKWLAIKDADVDWSRLIAYAEELYYRTYENNSVMLNLVICQGNGGVDITTKSIQKIIDPLASSSNVYFRINKQLKFLDYQQILWGEITDTVDYKFNPEFLQPFVSVLQNSEFSLHISSRGDITILNQYSLVAAKRKGKWYIYSVETLKNSIVGIIGNYRVACNMFEIVFDLSYKRHGALLIYDPNHQVIQHVVNTASKIYGVTATPDEARQMLAASVSSIRMSNANHEQRKKRLLLEVASIDGAVIFDDEHVLAFGAMVETHPDAGSHAGARTTAACSAYNWGGTPVKVSSDGDISILFKSKNNADDDGDEVDAELSFL